MKVLALDLTSEFGSLAIQSEGQIVAQQALESRTGFAHLVFGAIEKLLAEAQMVLPAIDCYAVTNGPGSFTGLRVALATAKGLAEATGKPVIGVSKLRAIARFGTKNQRAILVDARRGDVFAAVYSQELEILAEETVTKIEPWLSGLLQPPAELITLDAEWLRTALGETVFGGWPVVEAPRSVASAVAQCAEDDVLRGVSGDPAKLDANYVRRSDADLYWTDS